MTVVVKIVTARSQLKTDGDDADYVRVLVILIMLGSCDGMKHGSLIAPKCCVCMVHGA